MANVATSAEALRDRIRSSPVSLRELARRAEVSDSTVRRFIESGNANIKIVTRIEEVLNSLQPTSAESGPAASSVDVQ